VTVRAVLALGSNLGDRRATMLEAVTRIADLEGVELVAASTAHESVAVTPTGPDEDAPAYLNAVVIVETAIDPQPLLEALNRIEGDLGRVRGERWADRTLDIDIVAYGDERIATETLTVPHPRAAERAFVLAPWLEIDPAAELPGHGRVSDLLARMAS
jgi:dihydroneopterin aldolase / 2-amino-4-hydroxy-6-hydroxymethyldihydropteridine diphosphokinase